MKYKFTYEEIVKICPIEAANVLKKIRSGKSKSKDFPAKKLKWSIDLFKTVSSCSVDEMINRVKKEQLPFGQRYKASLCVQKNKAWASCALSTLSDVIVADLVAKELIK